MKFWTLSVKWVAWPMPPSGLAPFEPPQAHQPGNQVQETASASYQLDSRRSETVNSSYFNRTWTGLNATTPPPVIAGLVYDEQPTFPGRANGTADLNFNPNIDMGIDPFANQDDLRPRDPQQDGLGDYDTFSWH
jgi:hypothetical protein